MVLSLHKQPFVTTRFQFITAQFVRHCALKNALLYRSIETYNLYIWREAAPPLLLGERSCQPFHAYCCHMGVQL